MCSTNFNVCELQIAISVLNDIDYTLYYIIYNCLINNFLIKKAGIFNEIFVSELLKNIIELRGCSVTLTTKLKSCKIIIIYLTNINNI